MSRPRGYMEWQPQPHVQAIIDQVGEVFDTYREHLPLTVRQIFYRLVGAFDYPKDERAYKRLAEYLVKARRAELFPFYYIRDDGISEQGGGGYDSPADWWRVTKRSAEWYRRDRQDGQDVRIELWCEAAGMVPQMSRVASDYSVPVLSSGGFTSLTAVRQVVDRVMHNEADTTVLLHCGDYDPSGESIFESLVQDAGSFVRDESAAQRELAPVRVALTAEQVEAFNLPTAPPKKSDSRSVNWVGQTCQLEALPPDQLATVVREAIQEQLDLDRWRKVIAEEERERDELMEAVEERLGEEGQNGE